MRTGLKKSEKSLFWSRFLFGNGVCGVRVTVFPRNPSRNEPLVLHFTNSAEARLQSYSFVAISIAVRFDYYFILSLLCSLIDKHKNFISQSSLLLMEKMVEENCAGSDESKEKVPMTKKKFDFQWLRWVSSTLSVMDVIMKESEIVCTIFVT